MKTVRFVPKLFLPLALLTMSAVYAQDDSSIAQAPTAEQIAAQQAFFQNAGDQLASNLLQDPALAAWYNDASDEDVEQFNALCVQYATLNFVVYGNYSKLYDQLFNALSDLTGRTNWSVQISFMSQELAQAIQAQQAQQAAEAAYADYADDADDSDDDAN